MGENSTPDSNRIVILMRWLALVAFSLVLGWRGQLAPVLVAVLAVGAVWNLALSILNFGWKRLLYSPPLTAGVDVLIAAALVYFSAAAGHAFWWAVLLPILSAGLYLGLRNRMLAGAVEPHPFGQSQDDSAMVEIHQTTRKKIARDLHDGPTQSLAAIALRVNLARRLLDKDVDRTRQELLQIEELARQTTKEMRHMQFTILPLALESAGLVSALESLAEKTSEMYAQEVILETELSAAFRLNPQHEEMLFHIIEEAVNNARRHAQAEHVWVRLIDAPGRPLLVEVEDDGLGFDVGSPPQSQAREGLGLADIRRRTELIGGMLEIDSAEGRGTRIRVWLPQDENVR